MATSYFRERARNPYLRTPIGYEDEQEISPVSPTFSRPMPMAAEVIERPPLRAATPAYGAPPAFEPLSGILERERTAYEAKVPTTTGGRILEVLKGAGLNALQAVARNPNDPLGAAIGGAATGGTISAISPKLGRGVQFEMLERPRIEERYRSEEEQRQKARALDMDALKRREIEANIRDTEAQTKARLQPPKGATPIALKPGERLIDPATRQVLAEGGSAPLSLPAAEGLLVESEGPQEKIAQDTLRGRMESLKQRLSPDEQRYVFGPLNNRDDPQAVASARSRWDNILKTEMEGIRRYISEERKAKGEAIRRQGPGALKSGGAKPVTRPRSQFNSSKFPGLKFD
jgi:hypothetical protein